jgi:hypothetical protein
MMLQGDHSYVARVLEDLLRFSPYYTRNCSATLLLEPLAVLRLVLPLAVATSVPVAASLCGTASAAGSLSRTESRPGFGLRGGGTGSHSSWQA